MGCGYRSGDVQKMPITPEEYEEDRLDEALEESFPASDPPAPGDFD